jgi:hypothetical protein
MRMTSGQGTEGRPTLTRWSADDVKALFRDIDLNEEERFYLSSQAARLAYACNLVQKYCSERKVTTVLDIGPHFLTRCIKMLIRPEIKLSTVGFEYPKLVPRTLVEEHVHYDLTQVVQGKPATFAAAPFDLILFCETIEHLTVSPAHLLSGISSVLARPRGGLLIQTPNAVTLSKRIGMLRGRNPFELLHEELEFKGHIREYTMAELLAYGAAAGFSVWHREYCDYWAAHTRNPVVRLLERAVPSFRRGLTVFFTT